MASNGEPLIIDPSNPSLHPEDHIKFGVDDEDELTFGSATLRDDSNLGKCTIECVGLDVVARRRERVRIYKRVYSAYIDVLEATDSVTREHAGSAFRNLLTANNEYAAFARAFARKKEVDRKYSISIPVGADCGVPNGGEH
jgi:hypothetical protein